MLFSVLPNNTMEIGASVIGPNVTTGECALIGAAGSSSLGYNVTDDADCLDFGSPPLASDQLVANTLLGSLAPNGGPTQTMALQAGSQALNLIPPGALDCGGAVNVDQRGISRPQGTNCDAGAFEAALAPPPTPVASTLPNAAVADPATGSPLLALGFAALLIGSLGTLAFANVRRR